MTRLGSTHHSTSKSSIMYNNIISVPGPFKTIVIPSSNDLAICDIQEALQLRLPDTLLETCRLFRSHRTLAEESNDRQFFLSATLLGGKGGFGSQLRAAGGRMKKNKKANTEAMKDTSGRRLRTLKKAQELAEALRDAPDREREERKAKREKLLSIINAEMPGQSRRIKFDDDDYIQQSESILEDLKHAMEGAYHDDSGFDESEDDDDDEDNAGPSSALRSAFESGYANSKIHDAENTQISHRDDPQSDSAVANSEHSTDRSKGKGRQESAPESSETATKEEPEAKKRRIG